jgi:hypothetical protein
MSNNKQTAVEWLVQHWKKLQSKGEKMSWNQIIQITELAKEMEKEQIIDAYLTCHKEYTAYGKHWEMGMDEKETFEQYYNETYGGNK